MGKGIDAARGLAPLHAQAVDDMKDQLIIVLLRRLGGDVTLPIKEIDDTGGVAIYMEVTDGGTAFRFVVEAKQ